MLRRPTVHPLRFLALLTALTLLLAACGDSGDAVDIPEGATTPETNDTGSDSSSATADEGSEAEGDTEGVTISYLTHWPPEQVEALEAAIAQYQEENSGVTIEVQAVPFANLLSTLRAQAASPSGPTIASIYNLWLPELARDGVAAPVPDDLVADLGDNWAAGLVDSTSVEGTAYGYPNEVNTYALNYNSAILEQAGFTEPPATWDEVKAVGQAIADQGLADQGYGVITNWPAGVVHPWLSLVYSNGGNIFDGTTPTFDSPEVIEATAFLAELVELGVTDPAMGTADATTAGPYMQNFANGNTGMIVMANWWQSALQDSMGDDFENVSTALVPVGPSGDSAHAVSYSWLTMVNGNADEAKQAAAWDFLAWLNGPDSGENGSSAMGDLLISMGILPSRTSDIEAHADSLGSPFLQTYVDHLPDVRPFPVVIGGEELTTMVQSKIEAVIFGQLDPETAMQEAQTEATEILARDAGE